MMKNYKFIVPCVIIAFLMGLLVMSGIRRNSASKASKPAANPACLGIRCGASVFR